MPCFGLSRGSISLPQPPPTEPGDRETGSNTPRQQKLARKLAMFRNGRPYKPWYRSRTGSVLVVLWAIFTVFLGIMIAVIFVQPQWIGGRHPSSGVATDFGLYRNCTENGRLCAGKLTDFENIPSSAWKATTIFVLFAFLAVFTSLILILIHAVSCINKSGLAFRYSSGLQTFAGVCLLLTCLIYPVGWGAPAVRTVCGPSAASFSAGACDVKWAYWVAVVCMFDAFILGFLSLMFIEREGLTHLRPPKKRSPSFQINGVNNNQNTNGRNNPVLDISQENTKL